VLILAKDKRDKTKSMLITHSGFSYIKKVPIGKTLFYSV